ncbi:MAG: phosphate acyltransferase PlsX [Thermoleophilia bacterium]|nr:phosphate acyltransferase PlsX [Thermoleophilia bacterium]
MSAWRVVTTRVVRSWTSAPEHGIRVTSPESGPVVVAVDAMGGDAAPEVPVAGALAAAREGVGILLVGDADTLEGILATHGDVPANVEVVHASDRIHSAEDAVRAVRTKPDASMVVACRLVQEGRAEAVVSAGNTGAMLAASTLILRRLPGVIRPGLAVPMPSIAGPIVMIDGGANVECRPEYLQQFAVMGRVLARDIMGIEDPTVGILTIGEEAGKGTELVQQAYALLEGSPGFVGNIEGRDIPRGTARVIVTDGFTGNVALKLYEGTAGMIFHEIRRGLGSSLRGKAAGALGMPVFAGLRRNIDPEAYGGAYLLGVRGMTVIGHGNSGIRGMTNGILRAARGVTEDVTGQIEVALRGGTRNR